MLYVMQQSLGPHQMLQNMRGQHHIEFSIYLDRNPLLQISNFYGLAKGLYDRFLSRIERERRHFPP